MGANDKIETIRYQFANITVIDTYGYNDCTHFN